MEGEAIRPSTGDPADSRATLHLGPDSHNSGLTLLVPFQNLQALAELQLAHFLALGLKICGHGEEVLQHLERRLGWNQVHSSSVPCHGHPAFGAIAKTAAARPHDARRVGLHRALEDLQDLLQIQATDGSLLLADRLLGDHRVGAHTVVTFGEQLQGNLVEPPCVSVLEELPKSIITNPAAFQQGLELSQIDNTISVLVSSCKELLRRKLL
mmetsp:Transcript_1970/g.3031  ORF Transcript_1970/g.3031 Transcript_1970/m.3031 type:complete len:211 (+) Transcript_1970:57-689(+)